MWHDIPGLHVLVVVGSKGSKVMSSCEQWQWQDKWICVSCFRNLENTVQSNYRLWHPLQLKLIFFQINNLEKAVAAAHTFLKKNPKDPYLTKNMNYYKTLFDVEEYLIDHEEQPYEVRNIHFHIINKLNSCYSNSPSYKCVSLLPRVCSWRVWCSTTTETSVAVPETWSRPSHSILKYTTSAQQAARAHMRS